MNHSNAVSRSAFRPTISQVASKAAFYGFVTVMAGTQVSQAQNQVTPQRANQASNLISQAFAIANNDANVMNSRTRLNAVRGAASLLPQLSGGTRIELTNRWLKLVFTNGVARETRLDALSDFFDAATRRDVPFARSIASKLPDPSARVGAYLQLSERLENSNWLLANSYAVMAQKSARQETNARLRARDMAFIALRLAVLNPETRPAAVVEASSQVRLLPAGRERDYLLAEVVGASSKFDLPTSRRIAGDITDENLKNLAQARINLAEISQTSLTQSTTDRVAALAKASARYDVRAIPILLQLPPQSDVLRALSDALPAVYPTAQESVEVSLLERIWDYANKAEASVYKDQLQSRLARLMVLHDLWRGRAWGKQLAWKGGRIQVGAFLKQVAAARRSQLRAEPLQDLAERNVSRAIVQANTLTPAARVEALLLIAGQVLG